MSANGTVHVHVYARYEYFQSCHRVNKCRIDAKYYLIYGIIIWNRGISWKKQRSEIDLQRIPLCFDARQRGFLEFYC